jgi:transposase InsO family protein
MHYSQSEKLEIIRLVESSELGVSRTLKEIGINRSTFYKWYDSYVKYGKESLKSKKRNHVQWNQIPDQIRSKIVELALEHTDRSPRELACDMINKHGYYVSESSVYRILKRRGLIQTPAFDMVKAADKYQNPTVRVNQMWQTDFTYFKVIGWGWYYMSTILDDYSRYIVEWELCKTMTATDVERILDKALMKTKVDLMPRLLSDNGACYISNQLKDYMEVVGMTHLRGAPAHPQTQGKIERYHRSMKNVVKLVNYFNPEELKQAISRFVHYYNNQRYHESINNLTPSDVYFGREDELLRKRMKIKNQTMKQRRKSYIQTKLNQLKSLS